MRFVTTLRSDVSWLTLLLLKARTSCIWCSIVPIRFSSALRSETNPYPCNAISATTPPMSAVVFDLSQSIFFPPQISSNMSEHAALAYYAIIARLFPSRFLRPTTCGQGLAMVLRTTLVVEFLQTPGIFPSPLGEGAVKRRAKRALDRNFGGICTAVPEWR